MRHLWKKTPFCLFIMHYHENDSQAISHIVSQLFGLLWIKGTVSPDFKGFFMTYDIKSVLSAWALMVF